MKRVLRRIIKRTIVVALLLFFCWPIALLFLITSLYDVFRQKTKNKLHLLRQYFWVNGSLTFLFSPVNAVIDILCLPFINKQVYKLEDLPKQHQKEIKEIMDHCPKEDLIKTIDGFNKEHARSLLLYKWYGFNVKNQYPCPLFHKKFKKVLTIGVSTFNSQASTKQHFGWLRAGIRVLINIDGDGIGDGAYIKVNDKCHYWKENPLFIFDDTILHQSFNLTDSRRHCLFIDVTRPSFFPVLINGFVRLLGLISMTVPYFQRSSNWKIER